MKQTYKTTLQYTLTVIISLGIAIFLRVFVIDFYSIPSDSMEPTILPGDFILVDKVSFGARIYQDFEFLNTGDEPKTWRAPGITSIQRGDVLVFNFPYKTGWNKISMHLSRFYVKRCIGLPGDTIAIRNAFYEINGKKGFGNLKEQQELANYRGEFPEGVYHTIPFHYNHPWNIINMGPLYIPKQGDCITIDCLTHRLYHKMIEYESGIQIHEKEGKFYQDNQPIHQYTFQKNWYFFAGDHLWNSQDSRYIGLIPEEFIIGKAQCVLFSKNPSTESFRWKRLFKKIE